MKVDNRRFVLILNTLIVLSVLTTCERQDLLDDINERISELHEFTSFRFRAAQNPGLTHDSSGIIDHSTIPPRIVVSLPAATPVNALIPDFTIRGDLVTDSTGVAFLPASEIIPGVTVVDFTASPVTVLVYALNGSFQNYDIYLFYDLTATLSGPIPTQVDVPFTVDLSFTRAIDAATLGLTDFTVSSGSVTGITQIDATNFQVHVSPVADGMFQLLLRPNTVRCTYGTSNLQSNTYAVDCDAPPIPGNGGLITIPAASVGYDSADIVFTAATDRTSPLEYMIIYSLNEADLGSVASAIALGTPLTGWVNDPGASPYTVTVSSLPQGLTCWFTVLVRDTTGSAQHIKQYDVVSVTTKVNYGLTFEFILPADENVDMGSTIILSGQSAFVSVSGSYNYYRWYVDGVPVSGATANSLSFPFTVAKWSTFGSGSPLVGPHYVTCVVRNSSTGVYYTKNLTVQVGAY